MGESCGDSPPDKTDTGDEDGGAIAMEASEEKGGMAAATAAMPASELVTLVGASTSSSLASSKTSPSPSSSEKASELASLSESGETASRAGAGEAIRPDLVLTQRGTAEARSEPGAGESDCERG